VVIGCGNIARSFIVVRNHDSAMTTASVLRSPHLRNAVRARLRSWVVGVMTRGQGLPVNYDEPFGDPGLFGPDSVTWKVHVDFPGMMAGGICALMLQTLHPLALAGVWDHSDFRKDILGRLRRTTYFVAGTTYAPTVEAQRLIEHVRQIHHRVRGRALDGRRYSAGDPKLLTWVHVTEMWSFLRGFERYRDIDLPVAVQDRYFAETSRVAEALGARKVPKSAAAVEAYFRDVQSQLEFSERSIEVLDVLAHVDLPIPAGAISRRVFLGAGAALLPGWARRMMGRSRLQALRDRAAARSLRLAAPTIRVALREGIAARSCRRVGMEPLQLERW
jgi:uncharacterized protein (DUF2236 family)